MKRSLDQVDSVSQKITLRRVVASIMQTTTLLGCAAIIVGNVALSFYFERQKEKAIEDAHLVARNLNTAVEQFIVRTIKNVDQALLVARAEFARDPASFNVEQISQRDYFPSDLAIQLAVIGPDGIMRASNLQRSSSRVDLSDREHFRYHLDHPGDVLFISKPVLGRVSKLWTIQFTRKLKDANGRFAGVLVASVDPYYLSRISESIDIGATGAITLLGEDGIIRARGGANANGLGRNANSVILDAVQRAPKGDLQGTGILGGVDRIISYARIPGYPLIVSVSLGQSETLQSFEASKATLKRLLILVDLALVVVMALGAVETYRLNLTRERLSAKAGILSSTFANLQEGVVMIDAQGQVVAINNRALELMGLADEICSLPVPYASLPLARREGDPASLARREIVIDQDRTLEIRTSAMPGGGFVKTLSDVSARKHYEAVLEDARDKAEAASRARTAFLATMSHEIRTPLGGILSMVDLIGATELDPTQRRYVEVTRHSAEHLLQLIDDVLDVTKLDAEQVRFENIRFDLYRQIRSTLDIVSAKAQEKGLSIGCYIAPDTPREIMGDPGRLRQVLINLLGNAIKFTAQGHVLLEVSRRGEKDAERLSVRVEDTGIGIARESLPDLFRDFSQIDSSISRRFGGTGLGLAISRKLITRMGGAIGVESTPGAGSAFHFEIPLVPVSGPPEFDGRQVAAAVVGAAGFEQTLITRQLQGVFGELRSFDSLDAARDWLVESKGARRILLVPSSFASPDGVAGLAVQGIEPFMLCARHDYMEAERATTRGYAGVVHKPIFLDTLLETLSRQPSSEPIRTDLVSQTRSPFAGKLAGVRVLIAEDNPTNQFALRRMLGAMGAEVCAASDGLEALERAGQGRFDVILMDVMMPELDGLAAARAIRAGAGPNATTPIVALTASAFVEDREAALAAGMNSFATKPITGQQLFDVISDCRESRAPAEPAIDQSLNEPPVLDRRALDQLREDLGAEHLQTALNIFFSDLRARTDSLRNGDLDADVLRKQAHAIKGSAASFGFRRLASTAERLEAAARARDLAPLPGLRAGLLAEAAAAPAALEPMA